MFLCVNTMSDDQPFAPLFAESFLYVLMFPSCVLTLHHTSLAHPRNVIARISREIQDHRTPAAPFTSLFPLVHPAEEDLINTPSTPTVIAPVYPSSLSGSTAFVDGSLIGLSRGPGFTTTWVVYALLDDVIDGLRPVIDAMEYDVDCIDDLIMILNSTEQGDLLRRMRGATKKVTQVPRSLLLSSLKNVRNWAYIYFLDS